MWLLLQLAYGYQTTLPHASICCISQIIITTETREFFSKSVHFSRPTAPQRENNVKGQKVRANLWETHSMLTYSLYIITVFFSSVADSYYSRASCSSLRVRRMHAKMFPVESPWPHFLHVICWHLYAKLKSISYSVFVSASNGISDRNNGTSR